MSMSVTVRRIFVHEKGLTTRELFEVKSRHCCLSLLFPSWKRNYRNADEWQSIRIAGQVFSSAGRQCGSMKSFKWRRPVMGLELPGVARIRRFRHRREQ